MNNKIFYTTDRMKTDVSVNSLFRVIDETKVLDPHPGLIIATHHFRKPYYPGIDQYELLSLATMDLLNLSAYLSLSGYGKFTISLTINTNGVVITYMVGKAIPLTTHDEKLVPKKDIYAHLIHVFLLQAEKYHGACIVRLSVHVYMDLKKKEDRPSLSVDDRYLSLINLKSEVMSGIEPLPASGIRKFQHKKLTYHSYITPLKKESRGMKAFLVSDLETVLINNVHKVYAGGVMLVRPGQEVQDRIIHTYFSEEYFLIESFEERSKKVLYDLVNKIISIVKKDETALTFT